jgi:hypothetical protein
MDDLDRLSLEAAINTLQAETEFPGSQKRTSIEIAKQIMAQLEPAEQHLKEISAVSAFRFSDLR